MKKSLSAGLAITILGCTIAVSVSVTRRAEAADSTSLAVAFELCTAEVPPAIEKCEVIGDPPSFAVPSGRLLTIEQVSGDCGSDAEPGLPFRIAIVAQTAGVIVPHWIIGVPEPDGPGGLIPLTNTRIYADPNSSVTIGLTNLPSGPNGRFCRASFSGNLTKP